MTFFPEKLIEIAAILTRHGSIKRVDVYCECIGYRFQDVYTLRCWMYSKTHGLCQAYSTWELEILNRLSLSAQELGVQHLMDVTMQLYYEENKCQQPTSLSALPDLNPSQSP